MSNVNMLNALGSIINTSYGTSSTRGNDRGYALKYSMTPTGVKLSFNALVQFASESSLQQQLDKLKNECNQLINDDISRVKNEYKESTGESINLKSTNESDNLELVSASVHSPIKRAVYRREVLYDIS